MKTGPFPEGIANRKLSERQQSAVEKSSEIATAYTILSVCRKVAVVCRTFAGKWKGQVIAYDRTAVHKWEAMERLTRKCPAEKGTERVTGTHRLKAHPAQWHDSFSTVLALIISVWTNCTSNAARPALKDADWCLFHQDYLPGMIQTSPLRSIRIIDRTRKDPRGRCRPLEDSSESHHPPKWRLLATVWRTGCSGGTEPKATGQSKFK